MLFKNKKRVTLFFLLVFSFIFLLPFLIVTQFNDSAFIIGSPTGSAANLVKNYSGYQVGYILILQVLFFVTLIFWLFAKNKTAFFISVLTSFLNILCLPWIFIVLTFNINIDPPYASHDAGIGFYLLAILNFALFFYSIWLYVKCPKMIKESTTLLDDLN